MTFNYVVRRQKHAKIGPVWTAAAALVLVFFAAPAWAQRVFGVDTADVANASAPSQAAWNNAFNDADGDGVAYKFAVVRALFGNSSAADTQFYTNISRATTAGLLVGSYHYVTPDTTTGTAEATNYISKAGMYMKPGYLLPVLDLESGNDLSTAALTQWCLDYVNTIHAATGVYPMVYTNSSYNNDEVTAALAFSNTSSSPHSGPLTYQWLARPGSASLATGQPQPALPTYPDPYGVWDPNFTTRAASVDPSTKPWVFWQNGSGAPNGFTVDYNAANGNIEFVKDFLVPALWTNSGSGTWQTIANWNSNNPGGGTAATGPASRLPNSLDWVKLQNPAGGTVTLSSGAQSIRKLYTQQTLNITGGSLSIGYIPGSGGEFDLPAEFNAVVTLSNSAAYSAHSTQIDAGGGQFNLNGGAVTFHNLTLGSVAGSTAGKLVIGGNVTLGPTTLGGTGTATIQSATSRGGETGVVDLSAGIRTLTIADGAPAIDVTISSNILNGGLVKDGAGALQLSGNNIYAGGTTIANGLLTLFGAAAKVGAGDIFVEAGVGGSELQIQTGVSNAIADTATLSISNPSFGTSGFGAALVAGAGTVDLGAGINETVYKLLINGSTLGPGTYGSTSSAATFKNDQVFSGTGILTVLVPEPASASLLLIGIAGLVARRRSR
ncbi:MAG TPA: GH25 family lysozyme [Lacipirellulaceae bacterium]|nr:GH25 family lysozyme [Lacipirellulaceae bacterium]